MRVLGIAGSLRRDSHNTRLLRAAAEAAAGDVELTIYDGLRDVPPYDQDDDVEPAPEAVAHLRAAIAEADAILIATPEYNHSIPGQLKNALDWASRPFPGSALLNKPAAVIGSSTGSFGAVWAQAELKKVLGATGARVVPAELAVAKSAERFDADGELIDDRLRERLREVVLALAEEAVPAVAAVA
jgi:chromate reductase